MPRKFWQVTVLLTVLLVVLAMLVGVSACTPAKATAPASSSAPVATGATAPAITQPVAATTTTQAKAKDLIFESWTPPSAPVDAAKQFGQGLQDVTGGQITSTYNIAASMGPAPGIYNHLLQGVCDWAFFMPGYTPGVFPMTDILELPISAPNPLAVTEAMYEMYKKGYFDQEYSQVKFLFFYGIGPFELYSNKPINSFADFKGLKMRTPTDGFVNLSKALGGTPVTMTGAELYTGMEKGIVDACWANGDMASAFKLTEVSKYIYMLNIGSTVHAVAMNKNTFAALPDNAKKYIDGLGSSYFLSTAERFCASSAKGLAAAQQKGLQIVSPSADLIQQINTAAQPLFTSWASTQEAAGRPGKKALQDYYYSLNTEMGIPIPFPKPQ